MISTVETAVMVSFHLWGRVKQELKCTLGRKLIIQRYSSASILFEAIDFQVTLNNV